MDEETNETGARGAQDEAGRLDGLVEDLAGANRRRRQDSSHEIALVAHERPEELAGSIDGLVDALYRPEAQTRWEILSALTDLAAAGIDVSKAVDGAEASLFDEGSSTVRLASFRFLSQFGGSSPESSDQVWSLLDEAIQCFHGDPEYRDMLTCLLDLVRADISEATRTALVERITFDAENGRGYIRSCSNDIIKASKGE
ncbi:MAG: hypothetical protein WAY93_06235 [Atopobiaceae bacterium]|jgi:hypothetical protein|nr:hypothetical protein [Atopobiaceae bacterium]